MGKVQYVSIAIGYQRTNASPPLPVYAKARINDRWSESVMLVCPIADGVISRDSSTNQRYRLTLVSPLNPTTIAVTVVPVNLNVSQPFCRYPEFQMLDFGSRQRK